MTTFKALIAFAVCFLVISTTAAAIEEDYDSCEDSSCATDGGFGSISAGNSSSHKDYKNGASFVGRTQEQIQTMAANKHGVALGVGELSVLQQQIQTGKAILQSATKLYTAADSLKATANDLRASAVATIDDIADRMGAIMGIEPGTMAMDTDQPVGRGREWDPYQPNPLADEPDENWLAAKILCSKRTSGRSRRRSGPCKDDDECTEKGQFCYKHVYSQEFLHTHSVGICKAAGDHWDRCSIKKKHPCKAGLKCTETKRPQPLAVLALDGLSPTIHICLKDGE
ncbi:unnamed protein product [Vitrella brassicaformis CCMP3155]|uniref:Uncharacterized protein n=1 Tax=Vitrella brassicaformis (strain CCMP3155) TaxID=1169540 RepID=A0A0G4G538_VITBC|nr:unnamed protein product [Vitrella brassicaformis CCMP3155]|eukprot:CEM23218.1 unnamed protein product [Vitrella brassicaformis CCMP3155]